MGVAFFSLPARPPLRPRGPGRSRPRRARGGAARARANRQACPARRPAGGRPAGPAAREARPRRVVRRPGRRAGRPRRRGAAQHGDAGAARRHVPQAQQPPRGADQRPRAEAQRPARRLRGGPPREVRRRHPGHPHRGRRQGRGGAELHRRPRPRHHRARRRPAVRQHHAAEQRHFPQERRDVRDAGRRPLPAAVEVHGVQLGGAGRDEGDHPRPRLDARGNRALHQAAARLHVAERPPHVGEDVPPLPAAGGKFRFVEPDGRLLGLEYHLGEWDGEKCIGGLVPVFSADQPPTKPSRVVARPGYAVAGAEVHTGKYVYAIRLLFRRVKPDGSLDAADAYAGEWIGTPPPARRRRSSTTAAASWASTFSRGRSSIGSPWWWRSSRPCAGRASPAARGGPVLRRPGRVRDASQPEASARVSGRSLADASGSCTLCVLRSCQ